MQKIPTPVGTKKVWGPEPVQGDAVSAHLLKINKL